MNKETITTSIPDFTLRFAEEGDVELVLNFIKKLAEYEKLSHEVVATPKLLKEHLFGDNPKAEVMIGDYKNEPVAFALFFYNFSTFLGRPGIYLEDLFVNPEARGKGFGKTFLAFLADLAIKRGCGRLEWWVLDWNKPAISFYKELDAKPMDDWTVYRISGNTLKKLANKFENDGTGNFI